MGKYARKEINGESNIQNDNRRGYFSHRRENNYIDIELICSEDKLSVKKINKIKKIVAVKEERKCNIAIKSMKLSKNMRKDNREMIEILLRDKIKVNYKIVSCRISGMVMIVQLE